MIGYTTVGCNDFTKMAPFYDTVLAEMGGKRVMEMESLIGWSSGPNQPMFAIIKPFDGKPATVGNGVMIGLVADKPEIVDKVYAKAIESGAKDEGAAGPRGESGFYGGYFRDPEGNKLLVFCMIKPD